MDRLRIIDQKLNSNGVDETLFLGKTHFWGRRIFRGDTFFGGGNDGGGGGNNFMALA